MAVGRGLARRLAKYLRCVAALREEGLDAVSSWTLGEFTGVNSAQVRRDLSSIGVTGTRGVGYETQEVYDAIRRVLELDRTYDVVLVGAGKLGTAVVESDLISKRGFRITHVFDNDGDKIGKSVGGLEVRDVEELNGGAGFPSIGIIAVPSESAQEVAGRLVAAGVVVIVNYTDVLLHVPSGVQVHVVDPSSQLMHTLYYLTHSEDEVPA
jgi:redox-sensing transcriptional repressor